jgi:hypothetical protein
MRKLAILAFALAACAGDSKEIPEPVDSPLTPDTQPDSPPPPDAQVLDTSCAANPAPTTATATVTASGTVTEFSQAAQDPVPDATVDVCTGDCTGDNLLDSSTTDSVGAFSTAAIATNSMPLDGYLKISKPKSGLLTTNVVPGEPIVADLANVPGVVISEATLAQLALFNLTQDPTNGLLLLAVTDCATQPIGGADVTLSTGGNVFDLGSVIAQAAGTYIVLDVPVGTTTVTVTAGGTTFRARDLPVFANEVSLTQITPGFAAP